MNLCKIAKLSQTSFDKVFKSLPKLHIEFLNAICNKTDSVLFLKIIVDAIFGSDGNICMQMMTI